MKSHITPDFRDAFAALPAKVQQLAREAYQTFIQNPQHPSLQFKRLNSSKNIAYSVRIGSHYRALAYEEHSELYWFWIGSHETYIRLVKQV